MPVAMISLIVVSLLTPAPDKQTQDLVEHVRYPNIKGDSVSTLAH
jgi:cation/acetate symporter